MAWDEATQKKADEISEVYTGSEILGFLTMTELADLHARLYRDGLLGDAEDDESDEDESDAED